MKKQFYKKLSFLVLMLLVSGMSFAQTFVVDGIKYKVLTGTTNVEVIANTPAYKGSISIPLTVTYSSVTYTLTSIGMGAFYQCGGLTSIDIPNSITKIGADAFYQCRGLTSITIPNSVSRIGGGAFAECSYLTSVTIPNSVTSIENSVFAYCTGLTSITIPNSVTSIGNYAFRQCAGLTSITIPNSVTSIGSYAFYGCSGLTSVTFPNSITSIGGFAFYGCSGITSVTIPNSVTSIENSVFQNCSSLTSITVYWEIPMNVVPSTFTNVYTTATLYVPTGSRAAYQAAEVWKNFTKIVEPCSTTTTTLTESACDSYVFGTKTLTTSGVYKDTLINVAGCDSIITLNLTINEKSTSFMSKSVCDSYSFNNMTITQSGIYKDTLLNSIGCDSIVTIDLTIYKSVSTLLTKTACNKYLFNGIYLTQSGVYTQTLSNKNGCDSVVTLNLTINKVTPLITQTGITLSLNTTYQWYNTTKKEIVLNETSPVFTPKETGSYALIVSSASCSDTSNSHFVDLTLTRIESTNTPNFSIFPNPATANVTITLTESVLGTVSIVDLKGNILITKSISGNVASISTAELASGVYVVRINSDKGIAVKQLVVQ